MTQTTQLTAKQTWHELLKLPQYFVRIYGFEPSERVTLVKSGVPARLVIMISDSMAIPKDRLYSTLGLPRATINRKVRDKQLLNQDESERVLGIARLVGQVETMVKESGNPEDFDAAKWMAHWLEEPQRALGGRRPAELMDTAEGRGMVSDLLARMQSGAYT
jgi:putative toxin-antitoxin system antitoxin component (TIGR02293 family)